MEKHSYALLYSTPGTETSVTSFSFGPANATRKVYIQASLHADELPGSLVAHYLYQRLLTLEAQGALHAKVVLVPMCNPLGLRQNFLYQHIGRFDFATGQNYNRLRNVPLHANTIALLQEQRFQPSANAAENVATVRSAMAQVLAHYQPQTSVDALHKVLLQMAHDADIVLDLHCDNHAVLHVYTMPQLWKAFEPMARLLGSECQILSEDSESGSFDEMLSTIWHKLQHQWPDAAIPLACHSATVEFRGERDLSHGWARQDADALLQYLHRLGDVQLPEAEVRAEAPPLLRKPYPLEGVVYVKASLPGIAVYHVQPGDWVEAGQHVVDVVDPIHQQVQQVFSPTSGVVFAVSGQRFVHAENKLMSISGPQAVGDGVLGP